VLPLAGKVPLAGSGGVKSATTDPTMIRQWGRHNGLQSFGIATGHPLVDGGRLLVVDVDHAKEGEVGMLPAMVALRDVGALVPTVAVRTGGGGVHFYYRAPLDRCPTIGQRVKVDGSTLAIDWRGRGGYVVAPPSLHETGNRYRWARESEWTSDTLTDAPSGLLDLLCPRVDPAGAAPRAGGGAMSDDRRRVAYVAKVVNEEIAGLRATSTDRHRALARAAFKIAKVVNDAERCGVESLLLGAWSEVAPGRYREGVRTIADAMRAAGASRPAAMP
jgi:hypothetical protein